MPHDIPSGRFARTTPTPSKMIGVASAQTAMGAEPIAPAKSKLPLVIGGIAALAIAGVIAFVATRGKDASDAKPVPPIATAPLVNPEKPIEKPVAGTASPRKRATRPS